MTRGGTIVTLGESMGLLSAGSGGFRRGAMATIGIGGAESNLAIGVSRLGGSPVWAGRLGADACGDRVERELRAERVSVLVQRDPEHPTGLMLKEWPLPQVTHVTYYRAGSAGSRIEMTPELAIAVREAAILHVTGITPALSARAAETVAEAIAIARSADVLVSFDVNYRSALWSPERARAALTPILREADIAFAGVHEAEILLGSSGTPSELASRIARLGPDHVLIKQGGKGCVGIIDGVEVDQPAVPVQVVDAVGAGDAFAAGYLTELAAGRPAAQCLRTAVTAGALACVAEGDWEGLPTRADVELLGSRSDTVLR